MLGFDVFGRDSNYNPSDDPIVRVFAHEIRKKLEAYYGNEGANDPVRLEIPAGSYQPVFTRYLPEPATGGSAADVSVAQIPATHISDSSVSEDAFPAQQETKPRMVRRNLSPAKLVAGLAVLCLVSAVIGLALSNRELRLQVAETEISKNIATYEAVWSVFLKDNNPPLVILSNPPVLRFANPSDSEALMKDSIPLAAETVEALKNRFVTNPEISFRESPAGDNIESPENRLVTERNQIPRLILSTNIYTGMGEAIGLHYLTDFFRKASRSILLKQSRTLSAEDLKEHNVIMLGGVWVNEWSSKLMRSDDFVFTSKATIENRNPQPGEESEYIPQFDRRTGNLVVDYALITVKPNISAVNDVMLLAGIYSQGTEAAAECVTNKNYIDQLSQRLQQSKQSGEPPHYFQALLEVGVENGIPTTISILALHELRFAEP